MYHRTDTVPETRELFKSMPSKNPPRVPRAVTQNLDASLVPDNDGIPVSGTQKQQAVVNMVKTTDNIHHNSVTGSSLSTRNPPMETRLTYSKELLVKLNLYDPMKCAFSPRTRATLVNFGIPSEGTFCCTCSEVYPDTESSTLSFQHDVGSVKPIPVHVRSADRVLTTGPPMQKFIIGV